MMKSLLKLIFKSSKQNSKNSGFSIVELVCAVTIMALLGTSVAGIMILCSKTFSGTSVDAGLQQDAQLLVNQINSLIQDAYSVTKSDVPGPGGIDNSQITIKKGSDTILVYPDFTTNRVMVQIGGETQPLADNITSFVADVSDYVNSGLIQLYVNFNDSTGNRSFSGNYTVASRNKDMNPDMAASVLQINCETDVIVEPNMVRDIDIEVTGSATISDIEWELANNLNSSTTLVEKIVPGAGPTKTTLTLTVAKGETASEMIIYVKSKEKKADGLTPKAQKAIKVYLRRVTGVNLDGQLAGGTAKKNGAKYKIDLNTFGSNLPKKALPADASYNVNSPYRNNITISCYANGATKDLTYNKSSKTFENEFCKLKLVDIDSATIEDASSMGAQLSNGSNVQEFIVDYYNYAGASAPYFELTLKKDISSDFTFAIFNICLHPNGRNITATPYVDSNIYGEWALTSTGGVPFLGANIKRGSDQQVADWNNPNPGYLKGYLKTKTGIDESNYVFQKWWQVAEVLSYDPLTGDVVDVAAPSDWMYMNENGENNAINIRPSGGLILDPSKGYQVKVKWQVVNKLNGQVLWPDNSTPSNQYSSDGYVKPVTVFYNVDGVGGVTGSQGIAVHGGNEYHVNYDNYFEGIAGNFYDGNQLLFDIQRSENGAWVSAHSDDISIRKTQSDRFDFYVKTNRKGTYRVLLVGAIDHYEYDFATAASQADAIRNGSRSVGSLYKLVEAKRHSPIYNESTGQGIFVFNCDSNSSDWEDKYMEINGKLYYFKCSVKTAGGKKYLNGEAYEGHDDTGTRVLHITNGDKIEADESNYLSKFKSLLKNAVK